MTHIQNFYSLFRAKQFLKLVCAGVPLSLAKQVMNEHIISSVISIKKFFSNKLKLLKFLRKILHYNFYIIQILELMYDCQIMISNYNIVLLWKMDKVEKAHKTIKKYFFKVHPLIFINQLLKKEI